MRRVLVKEAIKVFSLRQSAATPGRKMEQRAGSCRRFPVVESGRQTIGDYYKKVLQLQITRWDGKLAVVVDQISLSNFSFLSFPFFFNCVEIFLFFPFRPTF